MMLPLALSRLLAGASLSLSDLPGLRIDAFAEEEEDEASFIMEAEEEEEEPRDVKQTKSSLPLVRW